MLSSFLKFTQLVNCEAGIKTLAVLLHSQCSVMLSDAKTGEGLGFLSSAVLMDPR